MTANQTSSRCRFYFNEYNPLIGDSAYLPLTSGKLHAYALTSESIKQHYQFMPYIFHIDALDSILDQYEDPGVAAFSVQIWNEQLCLRVASEVKKKFPSCLILFGGTQVPHHPESYFEKHQFIDVAVRAEGEEPFKRIMERLITSREFAGIPGVTWRHPQTREVILNTDSVEFEKDLDVYPSPYLTGLYDEMVKNNTKFRFQALIETNRGCPFTCTFCYWGKGGLSRKYRFYGIDRVAQEIEWIGKNKIAFVYNCDSNFGMHKRDVDIAHMMVESKKKYGYPEKVVNLYGKNTDDRIYEISKLLYQNGMHKGLGLSRQSMDETALENTRRSNIKLSVYKSLQSKFESEGIPTFTELILGLPGETYASLAAGISELMETSLRCQLVIVLLEIYPNTEMGNPDYQAKYGMITKQNVSYGVHSIVQDKRWVTEYIDYVIGTNAMPTPEWKRSGILAWTTMAMTSLRLCYYLLQYLHDRYNVAYMDFIQFITDSQMREGTGSMWRAEIQHYDAFMNQIIEGKGRAVIVKEYGEIYWAIEEATFLRFTDKADQFYDEMLDIMEQFLESKAIVYDADELREAVMYQRLRIPTAQPLKITEQEFNYNLPEFFSILSTEAPIAIKKERQILRLLDEQIVKDKVQFAKERLLWGRRGGKFERTVTWERAGAVEKIVVQTEPIQSASALSSISSANTSIKSSQES
jgi:putative methyltransferase